jgi:hypothetical protein
MRGGELTGYEKLLMSQQSKTSPSPRDRSGRESRRGGIRSPPRRSGSVIVSSPSRLFS